MVRFSEEVAEQLARYVYRLIDPRNGETFYVGKGKGNRLFNHVAGEIEVDEDELSPKLGRIRSIRLAGFEVAHVVHRHGLDDETAREVEAALIDAYPGITNKVSGFDSDRGIMHAQEIIERYEAPTVEFHHNVILITINRTAADTDRSIYEAVRYAWKIDRGKAGAADHVLAVKRGMIIGVYIADEWLPATLENFPGAEEAMPGRYGFVGREAPDEIAKLYFRKRVPDSMRQPGAANPVRYASPANNGP